jgi:tetratricopeptide (TPR) repeat protein
LAQAEEDYKKAIALSPGFVKCYLNRAMLYNESHRLKEAEDDYTKIISL